MVEVSLKVEALSDDGFTLQTVQAITETAEPCGCMIRGLRNKDYYTPGRGL